MKGDRSPKQIAWSTALPFISILVGVGLILLAGAMKVEPPEYTVIVENVPLSFAAFVGFIAFVGIGLVVFGVIYPYNALRRYVWSKRKGDYWQRRRNPRYRKISQLAKYGTVIFGVLGGTPAIVGGILVYETIGGEVGVTGQPSTDVLLGLGLILVGIVLSAGAVAIGAYFE